MFCAWSSNSCHSGRAASFPIPGSDYSDFNIPRECDSVASWFFWVLPGGSSKCFAHLPYLIGSELPRDLLHDAIPVIGANLLRKKPHLDLQVFRLLTFEFRCIIALCVVTGSA